MQGQGAAGFALRAFFVRARRHQKGRQERTKAVELYTVGIHDAGFHPRVKVQPAGWVKVRPAPTRSVRQSTKPAIVDLYEVFLCSAARSLPPLLMPYVES